MAPRKARNSEPQPILSQRRNNTVQEASVEVLLAVGGLIVTSLSHGNAVYITPGRFGGVQYKVYIEGDQFAEFVELNADTGGLVEAILEQLYDIETVGWFRRRFTLRAPEQPQDGRKGSKATQDTAKGGGVP